MTLAGWSWTIHSQPILNGALCVCDDVLDVFAIISILGILTLEYKYGKSNHRIRKIGRISITIWVAVERRLNTNMQGITTTTTVLVWILSTIHTGMTSAFRIPAVTTTISTRNTIRHGGLPTTSLPSPKSQSHPQPLFMSEVDETSLEEEVERLFQEEKEKTMRMSRFSNEKGMEYAPWMNMTPDD